MLDLSQGILFQSTRKISVLDLTISDNSNSEYLNYGVRLQCYMVYVLRCHRE